MAAEAAARSGRGGGAAFYLLFRCLFTWLWGQISWWAIPVYVFVAGGLSAAAARFGPGDDD
jgi:hypothetical protein